MKLSEIPYFGDLTRAVQFRHIYRLRWVFLFRLRLMLYAALDTNSLNDSNKNFEIFEKPDIVSGYATQDRLLWQEELILKNIKNIGGRTLDIGIGGGRTTAILSQTSGEYIGVDYVSRMVSASNKKFSTFDNTSFVTCDAKSFPFPSGTFDFVIFSFNGVDGAPQKDRLEILNEIRRVIKKEGTFVFSSHSLDWLSNLFGLGSLSLVSSYEILPRIIMILIFGDRIRVLKKSPYLFIGDTLSTYFVRKDTQLTQLHQAGFETISIVTRKGILRSSNPDLDHIAKVNGFLYYVCRP